MEEDVNKLLDDKTTSKFDNLSKGERQALQSLKTNNDIVIKKADKGSTAVVLNKNDYIAALKYLFLPKIGL